ncbi:helix-turn-helix domain-containing protein [Cytobacillus horneckiae]|uniref:helix-turn-helix domain-containing protein n=1 Tax=Cytobacillus horneckiae TaxID=549687 RepID=UPI003D263462
MVGSLGLNLRVLRFKLNKQQYKVAEELGISVRTLSRYEKDQVIPNKIMIKKLADYYGVTLQQLTEEDL